LDQQALSSFFDEMWKVAESVDHYIDNLYSTPSEALMPSLRQAHGLGKRSSWTEIGPVGQMQGTPMTYQRVPWSKEKKAEPAPPPGVSVEEWDKILSRKKSSNFVRDKLAELSQTNQVSHPKLPKPLSSSEKKKEVWRFIQKVGPAAGTLGGAVWGISKGLKGGALASKVLEGVGTGTLIGAVPSMMDEGVEALQRLRQKTASLLKESQDGDHGIQDRYVFKGLPIAIENVAGTTREGKDEDGHHWETKMKNDYGFIEGSKGKDGDAVDVYVGPKENAQDAFVVHQHKPDGTGHDEDKVILGVRSKNEAKELYIKHYDDPKFLGPIDKVSIGRLRELVAANKKIEKITPEGPVKTAEGQEQGKVTKFLRKAGPGIGGAAGLVSGALIGARRGKAIHGALAGLGAGATLGWVPDMAYGVLEGSKELQQ
jgi:hypothetical protein